MNWQASVLSGLSADSQPTVMISFDDAKYMFNAGEGTVRSQTHSESNRRRLKALFLSQLSQERAGGMPGLLMTVADASSINDLKIVGPTGLTHRLAAARLYTFRDNLRVDPIEVAHLPVEEPLLSSSSPIYKDHNISVYAQPLSIPPQGSSDGHSTETDVSLKRKRDPSPEPPRKRSNADAQSPSTLANIMSAPGFRPSLLPEDMAEEWRRLLIARMFPTTGTKFETSEPPKKKSAGKKGKGNKVPLAAYSLFSQVDEYRRSRARPPRGFYDMLPPPPASGPSPPAMSYVIVGPRVRGKFDVQKSIALGVPQGPLRGQLTKGQTITFTVEDTVTSEDGTCSTVPRTITVKPEECMGESEPPTAVIVLDVPSPEYIPSLLQYYRNDFDPLFSKLRSTDPEHRKEVQVRVLFHLVGEGVLEDPRYIDFMRGFGDDAQHIVASKEHCPNSVTFTSAAANQLRLSKLDPVIFPLQKFQMQPRRRLADIANLPPNTHLMVSNLNIRVRPPGTPEKNPNAIANDYFHPLLEKMTSKDESIPIDLSPETHQKFIEAQQLVQKISTQTTSSSGVSKPGDDVIVIPLGTGSAVPGKYRTVSSTLIQIPNWGNVLLDAGEGTYYQLARHFGEEGVGDVLRNLRCLFVSHGHADHHMGVAMLLRKRLELDPQPEHPLYLVTIRSVHLSLREMQALEYLGIQDISPSESTEPDSGNGVIPIMSEALHYKHPGAYTYLVDAPFGSSSSSSSPIVALAFDQASMRIGDMWKMQHYLEALEQVEKDTVAVEGEDEDEAARLNVE
ncbi:hypothetical protein MD484_g4468, partial [Candolleomyces efflorescens]